MPKWQTNDYYQNNFRLNKYDSATSYFKDSAALGSTTQFSQGGEFEILAGASTIGLSVAVAFAAAALAFWRRMDRLKKRRSDNFENNVEINLKTFLCTVYI